jgi:riboflavin synthase
MMKVCIVDTMFSRVNMGAIAIDELKKFYPEVVIERRTVPGVKDLAVECRKLLDSGCDSCLALGMVGGAPVDAVCGHEASLGIQQAKLLTGKHIVEVFVHENEGWSGKEFAQICENRIRKHAHNAVLLVKNPDELVKLAGMGIRQGKEDEGAISGETGRKARLAIIVSEFNSELTQRMEKAAVAAARQAGADYIVIRVPGAFDIPLVAKKMLMDKKNDGAVALGAVVKGETAHDEVVVGNSARLLADLSLEFRKPVTLGIIGHGADWKSAEARAEEYAERAVVSAIKLVKVLDA